MKLKLRSHDRPAAAAAPSPVAGAPKVAVIDDEPANVSALVALLRSDYEVTGFTNPVEALAYLSGNAVDVVLTDQRMPELRGTELLLGLREAGRKPVSVVVTGYTDVADLVFCINEGLLYRYVVKPWAPDDIRSAVREGLRAARQAAALERLVPGQVLRRLFPKGLGRLRPGRSLQVPCAVMFADLRGFTSIAESLAPKETFQLLSEYFQVIEPIIAAHGGFVDQFLGDGVLAMFDTVEGDAAEGFLQRAEACGRAIQEKMRSFASSLDGEGRGPGQWHVRIGVTAGVVTLGTVGCADRVEITAVGDTVVMAGRLEEMCKALGATMLVATPLDALATEGFRPLGLLPLPGGGRPVAMREYIGSKPQARATVDALVALAAVERAGDLDGAMQALERLAVAYPRDEVLQAALRLWQRWRGPQDTIAMTKERVDEDDDWTGL